MQTMCNRCSRKTAATATDRGSEGSRPRVPGLGREAAARTGSGTHLKNIFNDIASHPRVWYFRLVNLQRGQWVG